MKIQPLALCGFSFLSGLLIASWFCGFGFGLTVLTAAGIGCFIIGLILAFWVRASFKKAVAIVFFTLSFAFCYLPVWEVLAYRPAAALDGQSAFISGEIIDLPVRDGGRYTFTVKINRIDLENAPQHLKIRIHLYESAKAFDKIEGEFYFSLPSVSRGFDAKSFYKSKGIYLNAYAKGPVTYKEETGSLVSWLAQLPLRIRIACLSAIDRMYQPPEAALIKGILLGDTTSLSKETKQNFQDSGLAHILSVSGTHTVLLSGVLLAFLKKLRIKNRPACLITACLIFLFMAVTGFSPPVTRAGWMCILMLLGQILYREVFPLNSLGFSLMVILLLNPYAATDIGLLLSFSATLGIVVFAPKLALYQTKLEHQCPAKLRRLVALLLNSAGQSLIASLCVIPVTLFIFPSLSVIAPVTNLVASVTFQPIMVAGLLSLLFSAIPFLKWVAVVFATATALFTKLLSFIAGFFANLPFATLPAGYDFIRNAIAAVMLFLLILSVIGLFQKKKALSILCSVFIFLVSWTSYSLLERDTLRIAVFSDHSGGGVVITRPGHTVVIQGNHEYSLSYDITQYLKSLGIRQVSLYLGTDEEYMLKDNPIVSDMVCQAAAVPGQRLANYFTGSYIEYADSPIRYRLDSYTLLTAYRRNGDYYIFLTQNDKTVLITDYPYLSAVKADFLIFPSSSDIKNLQLSASIPSVLLSAEGLPYLNSTDQTIYLAKNDDISIIKMKSGNCSVIE